MGIETLAIASLAATAIGAGVSAVGSIKQGQAANQAAQYQSEVATQNAQYAAMKAQWTAEAGREQENEQGRKDRAVGGAIKAQQAASGVDVNTGSALDVQSSADQLGQLSRLNIRTNTARDVYGYRTQGANYAADAQALKAQRRNDLTAGWLGAAGSLLGGASSVGTRYADWQQQGIFA